MNYLQKKKLAFMSIANQVKGFIRTIIGALPLALESCVDENSIIDYKIYGESVQDGEPTPDNPIEVESVGDKTKNLFDIEDYPDTTSNNARYIDITKFKIGTELTISTKVDSQFKISSAAGATGILSRGGKTCSFTMTQEYIDIGRLYIISKATWNSMTKAEAEEAQIQLEYGLTPTEYKPYGYKIPVTASGSNLLSPYGWISGVFNGGFVPSEYNYVVEEATNYVECTFEATYRAIASNMIKVSEMQKIGCKINKNNENAVAIVVQFYDMDGNRVAYKIFADNYIIPDKEYIIYKDGNYFKSNASNITDYTIKPEFIYMRLFLISRQKISGLRIYDFYASKDADAEYEPYHEPITTNIYLDEPLRKVGDYADYVDFEGGKVVRKVGNYTFTGNETNAGGIQETSLCFGYSTCIPTLSLSDTKVGLCNYLYQGIYSNVLSNSRFAFLVKTNHPYVYIYFAKTDFPDLADYSVNTAKEIIKQWYDNNEPIILFYNLETPTEQPITLPTIPTFKGTTIVSADTTTQPSNTEIEYYSNVKENNYGTI